MKKRVKSKKTTPVKTQLRKKSNYSNLLTPLIVLGTIIVGSIIWYTIPRPTPVGINLVGSASGTVDLTLTPATTTIEPNVETTLTLSANSGTNHITTAQIELAYDTTKINTPTLTLSDTYPIVLIPSKVENGKITFTIGAPTTSGGIAGTSTLATIKIKSTTEGVSSLSFTENTIILVAENSSTTTNDLKSAAGSTVTIATPIVASPSTAASADPSTPASADPSIAASPSPSPSAPAAEKPAKPTGLRSNCYDDGNKITLRWDAVANVDSYKVRMDQKDGNNDKSNDGIKSTEYNYDIIAGQKYSWWVHSTRGGIDSEEAKINEVVCDKTVATPTPTPSIKPTVKPTSTPKTTPKPTVTPKVSSSPASSSTTQYTVKQNNGSLNDIFTNPDEVDDTGSNESVDSNKNIWQKFLEWLGSLFTPAEN